MWAFVFSWFLGSIHNFSKWNIQQGTRLFLQTMSVALHGAGKYSQEQAVNCLLLSVPQLLTVFWGKWETWWRQISIMRGVIPLLVMLTVTVALCRKKRHVVSKSWMWQDLNSRPLLLEGKLACQNNSTDSFQRVNRKHSQVSRAS